MLIDEMNTQILLDFANACRLKNFENSKEIFLKNEQKILSLSHPLMTASMTGHLELVIYFLTESKVEDEKLKINWKDNLNNTALLLACANGQIEVVKYLLTHPKLVEHANINQVNKNGLNALFWALKNDHIEVVKYLLTSSDLKEKINIHHKDNESCDALMYACEYSSLNSIKYLLNNYSDIFNMYNTTDKGYNALLLSCMGDGNISKEKDKDKYSVIHYLLIEKEMIIKNQTKELLKEHGYDDVLRMINARDLHHNLQGTMNEKSQIQRKKI